MTKEDGIRIREARRARVRRIRGRVIGGSVALFLAVWMLITIVLVTGHDPALARKTQTQTATAATSSAGTTTSSTTGAAAGSTSATASTSSGATSSSTGSSSSGLSPVTSSQS